MPVCCRGINRLVIKVFAGLLALLTLGAEAMAWSRYPVAYHPGFRDFPPAFGAPPGYYGRLPPVTAASPRFSGNRAVASDSAPQSPVAAGRSQAAALPAALSDDSLTSAERKALFIATLLPIVQAENTRLQEQRQRLNRLQAQDRRGQPLNQVQSTWLEDMAANYRVDSDTPPETVISELLERVDVVPAGLAVAQAANESAWGTSRFARQANNLFGTWTWDPDKGIKPLQRAAGKTHLVRVYDSVTESVRAYLHNLNSHPAYQPFRDRRALQRRAGQSPTAVALAEGLTAYSELGDEYVARIQSLITDNRLEHAALL